MQSTLLYEARAVDAQGESDKSRKRAGLDGLGPAPPVDPATAAR